MLLGKAFCLIGRVLYLGQTPEVVCVEAINICNDDFSLSSRAVSVRVVLWNGRKSFHGPMKSFTLGLYWHGINFVKFCPPPFILMCWSCCCTWLLKTSLFCLIAQSICVTLVVYIPYVFSVEIVLSSKSLSQGPVTRKYWNILLNLSLAGNVARYPTAVLLILARTAVEINMQFVDSLRYVVNDVIQW
jgi:hypothetical protein